MPHLTVYPDYATLVNGAADFVARCATEAIASRGQFVIALAGGATPRAVYARLAEMDYREGVDAPSCTDEPTRTMPNLPGLRVGSSTTPNSPGRHDGASVDWSRVHIFFGDERCVPPDDARSNFRMAREALLARVALPPQNIHRIRGEDDPALAAFAYEQQIARVFRCSSVPAFDLILLGLGENGHTASLFPGSAALRETVRWVVAQYVEVVTMWRVTFTPLLINAARRVCFLVAGAAKAAIVQQVLHGPYQPEVWPAQLIQPTHGELHWLLDAAAAAKIQPA